MGYSSAIGVLLVILFIECHGQQRTPPGVNPSHYQQQPQQFQQPQQQFQQQGQFQQHPQQFQQPQQFQGGVPQQQQQQQQFGQPPQQFAQQPPQQFAQQPQQQFAQQPPQQFAQQPPQQFAQPQPQQQFAPQPGQHPQGQRQVLHKDMEHEREHMKEHMDVPIDTSNMSEQELQFHYFKMHDADGNNKLDGCELVKSLIHWHDQSNHDAASGKPIPEEKIFKDDELMNMIDPILASDDKNRDGYIDYPEFVQAQQAAQARHAQAPV